MQTAASLVCVCYFIIPITCNYFIGSMEKDLHVGYGDEDDKGKKKKGKKGLKRGKKKKYGGYDNHPLYCLGGDISLIGNGVCDKSMNNPQCHYDGGDCDY